MASLSFPELQVCVSPVCDRHKEETVNQVRSSLNSLSKFISNADLLVWEAVDGE
jgi:hypothetical protein